MLLAAVVAALAMDQHDLLVKSKTLQYTLTFNLLLFQISNYLDMAHAPMPTTEIFRCMGIQKRKQKNIISKKFFLTSEL